MNFLFGKKPDIFNQSNEVQHNLDPKSWEEWKSRYTEGREYDWSQHSGAGGGLISSPLKVVQKAEQERA